MDFNDKGTRHVHTIVIETFQFQKPGRNGKLRFDCAVRADRGSDLQDTTKSTKQTRLTKHHAQDATKMRRSDIQRNPLDMFATLRTPKTAQSCDKLAHPSHHNPDLGKHNDSEGEGAARARQALAVGDNTHLVMKRLVLRMF